MIANTRIAKGEAKNLPVHVDALSRIRPEGIWSSDRVPANYSSAVFSALRVPIELAKKFESMWAHFRKLTPRKRNETILFTWGCHCGAPVSVEVCGRLHGPQPHFIMGFAAPLRYNDREIRPPSPKSLRAPPLEDFMRKAILLLLVLIGFAVPTFAQTTGTIQGYCDQGSTPAKVQGLNSNNYLDGVIPSCRITVYLTGTQTLATLYANELGTPLSNPFTANTLGSLLPGHFIFWAAINQGYDVTGSGGIPPNAYPQPVPLLTDVFAGAAGGAGSVTQIVAGTNITISPSGGTGAVTINATGGCGPAGATAGYFLLNNGSGGCSNADADYGVTQSSSFYFGDTTPAGFFVNAADLFIDITGTTGGMVLREFDDGGIQMLDAGGGMVIGETTGGTSINDGNTGASGGGVDIEEVSADGGITLSDNSTTAGTPNTGGINLDEAGNGGIDLFSQLTAISVASHTRNILTLSTTAVGTFPTYGSDTFTETNFLAGDNFSIALARLSGTMTLYTGSLTPNDCLIVNGTGTGIVDAGTSSCNGGGGGGSAFSAITSGSNTAAAMVVGSGASLGASGSGTITATAVPFSGVSSATNTTGALVVGTGGSLGVSGTGTIGATSVGGITVSGTPSSGQVLTATSASAANWQTPGSGTPGGSSGAIQYNNSSAFGGVSGTGFVHANGSSAPTILASIPYADLPALSANQVLGALTATTPSGLTVPSCSGTANALTWDSGVGFGCNTITSGSSITLETNGSSNTSQTLLNFTNPSSFNGLSFAFSNPSGGVETFGVSGTLNNAGLSNSSITLGTSNVPLGGTLTSAAGFNAATSTALAATPSQCLSGLFATGISASGNAICSTPPGGGNVSTSGTTTSGYYPVLNGATTITDGHLDDGITTASTITSSEAFAVNCTSCATQIPMAYNSGHAPVATSGKAVIAPDTSGNLDVSENNGTFFRICTSGNGQCIASYPGAGVANSTGSAWGTSYSVNGSGAGLVSGPASATSGDIATFTGAGGQIQDSSTLLSSLAPLASPTFTGIPAAPTAAGGTNTTQLATTAFVKAATSGAITPSSVAATGALSGATIGTATNCSSSAAPAACGSAAAGSVVLPTNAVSSSVVVNTSAVTANSQIFAFADDTLGTKLGVTCNSTVATLVGGLTIFARTAGTSFTISNNVAVVTNPLCVSYLVVN